jgi:hypothetical protein
MQVVFQVQSPWLVATQKRRIQMEENANVEEVQETESRTYTQEEVEKLLQSEADKRVTAALKKAERKQEAAVKEAARLAKMDEEQRYQYELEQREKAIAAKERELALAENKAAAATVLSNRGLSAELVNLVVAEDADVMNANISLLEKAFKQSVKNEVEKRLASTTPKKNLPMDNAITQESFRHMSLAQQVEIFNNQPELYKSLTQ